MQFPLKPSADSCQIPTDPSCLCCGTKAGEIEGFIRLTTGAILYTDRKRDTGGPSHKMDTVFSLWYHGPHPIMGVTEDGKVDLGMNINEYKMDVVEPLSGGQVDIHFCSTSCLSRFFTEIVTSFQSGIDEANKAEQIAATDRHQHNNLEPTTPQPRRR